MILASTSPRRLELVKQLDYEFKGVAPPSDEELVEGLHPYLQVQQLAFQKALSVINEYPDEIVISGDTLVVIDHQILGKPTSQDDALRMLSMMNSKTHEVITGLCVMSKNKTITKTLISEVKLKDVSDEVLKQYVFQCQPLDKAGAYGIQDDYFSMNILDSYTGYLNTIIGFPIEVLDEILKEEFE